jgi:glutaredoxin
MYFQDSCPHCSSAKKALQKQLSGMELKDLKIKANYAEFQKSGGRGVPYFVSKSTGKAFAGNPGSYSNLLAKLGLDGGSAKPSKGTEYSLRDLKVKIFVSDSCGYCKRLKQLLNTTNNSRNVRVISLSDSDYQKEASKYKFSGYPFIVSETTGKTILGAPPSIDKLVSALQS